MHSSTSPSANCEYLANTTGPRSKAAMRSSLVMRVRMSSVSVTLSPCAQSRPMVQYVPGRTSATSCPLTSTVACLIQAGMRRFSVMWTDLAGLTDNVTVPVLG